jgi:hypothetical protein
MQIKPKSLSIFVVVFAVGLAAGFWILLLLLNKNFLLSKQINFDLDPINLLTLLVTIFLAIYITGRLEKINEQERVLKDLMIDDLKDFKFDFVKEIREILKLDKIGYNDVVGKLRTLRQSLNALITIIKKYKFLENQEVLNSLDSKVRDIRDLFTDTPSGSVTTDTDIKIEAGKISLGTNRRENIEVAISDIRVLIFELVVEINKK